MAPFKRKLWAVAATAAVTLSLAACQRSGGAHDDPPMIVDDHGLLSVPADSPLRSHLTVQTVVAGADERRVEAPAAVEADPARVINILAPLTGRVAALKVGLGDRVHRGQPLLVIASGDMAQANADVDKAQDAFTIAKKSLLRAQGVREAGGAADKDLEAAQSAFNQAQAELTRAQTRQASLNGLSGGARELVLTAPQDGVVTSLAVAAGAQVSDPTATLLTVSNIDRVFVTANLAESDLGSVAAGQDAEISLAAFPGETLHGRVTAVNPLVEPDTRRRKVRIALANDQRRLLPNMYGEVTFTVPSSPGSAGVTVPQSALLMNNDALSVMVEVHPWVFQRRLVKIADENDTTAQVVSGLAAGERIVVRGGVLLND